MKRPLIWMLYRLDEALWPTGVYAVAAWRERLADRCYDAARRLEGRR